MEPDDLLCSRNARPQKDREGAARCLLARRTRTVKLCSFDARSKGNLGHSPKGNIRNLRPSLGLMARLGVPVGGRVRKSRAVEGQSDPIPEEATSKLRRSIIKT